MARIEPMESVGEMSPIPKWILVKAHDFWNRQDVRKDKKIPMQQVKESLLMTDESNRIPNALVIELLRKADENEDGYLDYDEYMKFAEAASTRSRGRDTFSRAAMTIIPRNERTVEKRTYFQNYSCCPPPFFMVLATFVETGVFVYYMVDMGEKMEAAGPAPIYSPLIYNPKRRYECWRYLSYALIHSGYMHLINNLVVQFVLGIILEVVHGWWRIGTIYLSGVLFGVLAQSISDPDSYLAGASAGVFSVEYAHLGNMLMNWSQMEFRWLQLVVIIVLSFSDVGFAVWDIYFNGNKTKVSVLAKQPETTVEHRDTILLKRILPRWAHTSEDKRLREDVDDQTQQQEVLNADESSENEFVDCLEGPEDGSSHRRPSEKETPSLQLRTLALADKFAKRFKTVKKRQRDKPPRLRMERGQRPPGKQGRYWLMVHNLRWYVYMPYNVGNDSHGNYLLPQPDALKRIKKKWIPLKSTGYLQVHVNGFESTAGITTDEMFNESTITHEEALNLRIHHSIEIVGKFDHQMLYGRVAVIGRIRDLEIQFGNVKIVTDVLVHDRRMYPKISLGRHLLAEYGAARKFKKDKSFLCLKNKDKKRSWQYDYLPEFPLLTKAYTCQYNGEIFINVTERPNTYVTRKFLDGKQLYPFLKEPTEEDKRLEFDMLHLMLGHDIRLEPVVIHVLESVTYGQGDIMLGTEFLHKNRATVDYVRRCMILKHKKDKYCISLFSEHGRFGVWDGGKFGTQWRKGLGSKEFGDMRKDILNHGSVEPVRTLIRDHKRVEYHLRNQM